MHRQSLGLDELDVLVKGECPTACGNDSALEIARRAEEIALAFAKVWFALLREDLANGHLLGGFNEFIEIEERHIEPRGKLATDGRLSGAHESDQVDFHCRRGSWLSALSSPGCHPES